MISKLLVILFLVLSGFSVNEIRAQEGDGEMRPRPAGNANARRPNLLQELGLSADQVKQLRRINSQFQPQFRLAQRNLGDANRLLDEAVYSDEADDELIKSRMAAVQSAHSEMLKARTMMETSIRRVLTRPQLLRFRELRQRVQDRQNPGGGQPQRLPMRQQRNLPKPKIQPN